MSLYLDLDQPDVNIHQMYLDLVVNDDLQLAQDSSVEQLNALLTLENIKDELDKCVKSREELLDYFSQDSVFFQIVGTENRYEHLCDYLKYKKIEESDETIGGAALAVAGTAGFLLPVISEAMNKFLVGMRAVAIKVTKAKEMKLDEKCRYALQQKEIQKAIGFVNQGLSAAERWVQNPDKFDAKQAIQLMNSMQIKIDSPDTLEKVGAGSKAALIGLIEGLINGLGWGIVAVLISIVTLGIAALPAMVYARFRTWHFMASNSINRYKNNINAKSDTDMASLGWTPENFKQFANDFIKICTRIINLKKLMPDSKIENKESALQLKGFLTIIIAAAKGLGKSLVAMADAAELK